MRLTVAIDSATADEAHDLIIAFQRMRGVIPDGALPTVTCSGSWAWNVTLPPLDVHTGTGVIANYHQLADDRARRARARAAREAAS